MCCLLCGGLRDEDQYLLRHSSPALDHESPCGQHMLLAHLEHQDKEQLQCTLVRLENENRSVSGAKQSAKKKTEMNKRNQQMLHLCLDLLKETESSLPVCRSHYINPAVPD